MLETPYIMAWLDKEGVRKAPGLWEVYVKGPESDPDPSRMPFR